MTSHNTSTRILDTAPYADGQLDGHGHGHSYDSPEQHAENAKNSFVNCKVRGRRRRLETDAPPGLPSRS